VREILGRWFTGSPLLVGPILALVLFAAIFAVVAVRTWRKGASAYAAQARLPLEGDDA